MNREYIDKLTLNIDLLGQCVEVWKEKINMKVDELGRNLGTDCCPLCEQYYNPEDDGPVCRGCPIYEEVNRDGCMGTPYTKVSSTRLSYLRTEHDQQPQVWNELQLAIETEIKFLSNLQEKLITQRSVLNTNQENSL